MAKKEPTGYVKKDGYLVTVADAVLLESDVRLFGTSFMEGIGCGYARRISPSDIIVRKNGKDGNSSSQKVTPETKP